MGIVFHSAPATVGYETAAAGWKHQDKITNYILIIVIMLIHKISSFSTIPFIVMFILILIYFIIHLCVLSLEILLSNEVKNRKNAVRQSPPHWRRRQRQRQQYTRYT